MCIRDRIDRIEERNLGIEKCFLDAELVLRLSLIHIFQDLIKYNIPLVLVDRSYPDLPVNSVLINNYEISYKSTEQLIQQGCRNIAFVTYKQDHFHINERKRGYCEAMKEADLYKVDHIQELSLIHI